MVSLDPPVEDALTTLRARHDGLPPVLARGLDAFARVDAAHVAECGEVLNVLARLACDDETTAALLWFYVALVDPDAWKGAEGSLPTALARLVGGQLGAEQVWELHARNQRGSEGLRRLLLAIIHDLRVVFALLARQLVRMRHASALPPAEAVAMAQLTADIHAPLANRLGIWQLKWELEDQAFHWLHPEEYKHVARLLHERRADRETFIAECLQALREALGAAGIHADVAGRPKHIYSIWRKMQRKHLEFDELYDIRAMRVMVGNVADCYGALGVVHALWPHLPREFDDYIARPKDNGYRSLHTAVVGPHGRTVEVQIRTHEMHRINELGVAAHWRYKEGGPGDVAFEKRIAWMRRLLDARGDDDQELLTDFQTELIEDRVYLLTPGGDVLDLPRGATVLDFAYRVHTEVGHRCRGAKVNGRIVPLTFQPRSGDRVEVITGKVSEPSRDWLSPHRGYLNTARAQGKLRAWFRRCEREANLAAGRQILDRELKRLALGRVDLDGLPAKLGLKSQDELLEAVALGEIGSGQLARAAQGDAAEPQPEVPPTLAPPPPQAEPHGALKVGGMGNLMTNLARCCQPVPGDDVRGFITRARGISVHRADCASLAHLARRDPERIIEVEWGEATTYAYQVDIGISGYDRKDLYKDVVASISSTNTPIAASSSKVDAGHAQLLMRFTLRVRDFGQLSDLMGKLSVLPGVVDVHRVVG